MNDLVSTIKVGDSIYLKFAKSKDKSLIKKNDNLSRSVKINGET